MSSFVDFLFVGALAIGLCVLLVGLIILVIILWDLLKQVFNLYK